MESWHYSRNTIDESGTTCLRSRDRTCWWPQLCRIDLVVISVAILWGFGFLPAQVYGIGPRQPLILVGRTITQNQGGWVVDYRFRNTSRSGVIVTPEEFKLKVEGWVSNSRVASHAVPRWSSLIATPHVDPTVCSDVIARVEELYRCRERLAISLLAEDRSRSDFDFVLRSDDSLKATSMPAFGLPVVRLLPLSLGSGHVLRLRLRIDHQHILYGDYDPLLGVRTVELSLGSSVVRDLLPLDREQYLAQPKYTWPDPPSDRRDTRYFVSAPDSLHLEADVQGHQNYRYEERPVRYNSKMRLRFWYLIAAGTEGDCCIRISQNKDTPLAWRQLHEAGFEEQLETIGHWTKYERIIQTEPEATRLILEFKILGEIDIGEMWIDDVTLEPVGNTMSCEP
jgi:hypothetical protein